MPRRTLIALTLLSLVPLGWWVRASDAPATPSTSNTMSNTMMVNGHRFTLPVGFTIELVAGPNVVKRPITADVDEQGRLYVAESSGSNEPVAQQLEKRPHSILRLEDRNGDGVYDHSTVFADRMMFPEGTMWHNGSLYVAAPPSIWKLTDTDGDGVADRREEWFNGKTLTGCANDLHGPYRGPDGWIYWCKGAFAKQDYTLPNGKPFSTRASHIFRCRPDGTGLEPVMTGGMDNPVDTVFLPTGERIFTTTFFQHPSGGQRDGLIHAIYGGIYGKDHDPIYEHIWTSPKLMPVLSHMGPAAPCGLHRFQGDGWGVDFRDNLFASQFNLRKISRHQLQRDGATFRSQDSDFIVSDQQDFHPTDVLQDVDGSLLIVDTGGWYKLCCPTSQLVKPDVFGAIYRVRKKDGRELNDPLGKKVNLAELTLREQVRAVTDPRPSVRTLALNRLPNLPVDRSVRFLLDLFEEMTESTARQQLLWASFHLHDPVARQIAHRGLKDADPAVRLVALHGISLYRDRSACDALIGLLNDGDAAVRRAVAEALGRIGDAKAIPALLGALEKPLDRALEHSLIYALIEIGDADALHPHAKRPHPAVRRALVTVFDQLKSAHLLPADVIAMRNDADAANRDVAWWIIARHPEWGGTLVEDFRQQLRTTTDLESQAATLSAQFARLASNPSVQAFLAELLNGSAQSPANARLALRAMSEASPAKLPKVWADALIAALQSPDRAVQVDALTTMRKLPAIQPAPTEVLSRLADADATDMKVRLLAAALLPAGQPMPMPRFNQLLPWLVAERPNEMRLPAVDAISKAALSPQQLASLLKSFSVVGPMDIDKLLEPYARSTDEAIGQLLVDALKSAPARSALRIDAIKSRLLKYPAPVQVKADGLYQLLNADLVKQREKLEAMLPLLQGGDVRRGQAVFNSAKAACISCHAIGYVGGKVGPDLTRIGKVRNERDLLEAILFPSASFVRSYEPVSVVTKSGKVLNGILRKDAPDEVVLTIDATNEVRIARADIDEMEPGKVSVMPAGLDQQLTPQELADLVAFLRASQ